MQVYIKASANGTRGVPPLFALRPAAPNCPEAHYRRRGIVSDTALRHILTRRSVRGRQSPFFAALPRTTTAKEHLSQECHYGRMYLLRSRNAVKEARCFRYPAIVTTTWRRDNHHFIAGTQHRQNKLKQQPGNKNATTALHSPLDRRLQSAWELGRRSPRCSGQDFGRQGAQER